MKKDKSNMRFFLPLFLLSFLFGGNFDEREMLRLYKQADYKKVCRYAKPFLNKMDNSFLSLVGDACAKEDDINILGIIVAKLNKTKSDRANASYFATLILQKKLIYQFMNDGLDLSGLVLPKTTHILSKVFEKLAQKKYEVIEDKNKKLRINDGKYMYIVWLSHDKPSKVYIGEYKNGLFLKKHWYR